MLKRNISGIRKNSGSFPSSDYPAHSWTNILKKYSGIDYKPQHQCGVSALPKGQSTTSITLTYNKTINVQTKPAVVFIPLVNPGKHSTTPAGSTGHQIA